MFKCSEYPTITQHKVTVQITEQLSRLAYAEHCQTFKMEHFAKKIMPECRCATRDFSLQGRFCGTRVILKLHFEWKLYPKDQGLFFHSGHFFRFSKKGKGGPPHFPPSCTPVSVAKYASISFNIPRYNWKCLNKLSSL